MVEMSKVRNVCDDSYVCWGCTEFPGDSESVNYKLLSTEFLVFINGVQSEVRECRVSAVPFNRPWPGKQRAYEQSESAGFVSFSSDEEVEIRVCRKKTFHDAVIRPLARNVDVKVNGDEVLFTLKEPGQYVLEFGNTHNVLHIFFNEIKEYPESEKATWFFGPGIHFPGVISLRDNDIVYVDKDAVVFGSIHSLGAKNVKIFGGGVIDNSCEERITEHCYESHTKGTFRLYNCTDITVSDIILTNSSTWAMSMFNCSNIKIDNVKIVGHWRYNTDGIDIVNSDNVLIENSFIRSFDDTISIKGIYEYDKCIENIEVNNCVMWCGWGKTCEIGIETTCAEYKNIIFRNCDLIHNSLAAMAISNGNYADMHDIIFDGINVELQSDTLPEVIQTNDNQKYDATGKILRQFLVLNSNYPYRIRHKSIEGPKREKSDHLGNIHDVKYRNIRVFTDSPNAKPKIRIESYNKTVVFKNFEFENISINGLRTEDFASFDTSFQNCEDVIIK